MLSAYPSMAKAPAPSETDEVRSLNAWAISEARTVGSAMTHPDLTINAVRPPRLPIQLLTSVPVVSFHTGSRSQKCVQYLCALTSMEPGLVRDNVNALSMPALWQATAMRDSGNFA